ncbi:MAG TPA: peptidase S41, partial [Burkholderiaceae bacterium]|nr:peptidase S41 [Burkholderiaceae bacterium]
TSCGRPVGFSPVDDGCGETYSVVNFEAVNASNEGRFFNGLDAQCVVAEDFSKALGAADEPLLAAAGNHADGVACPVAAATARQRSRAAQLRQGLGVSAASERPSMIAR